MDITTPLMHTTAYIPGTHKDEEDEPRIDNAYLDAFLRALPNDCTPLSLSIFICKPQISNGDFRSAKKLLIEMQLITEQPRAHLPSTFQLTPLGKDFLDNGGFENEQKRKDSSLPNILVAATIIISVIAIVSIVALFISIYGA